MQASGRTWIEKSGCVSCHHQALPAVSVALARARGFSLDEEAARQRVQATLARFAPDREDVQSPLGIGIIGGGALGAGYALLGLAAANVSPNATTDAMVHFIIARQLADGRFHSPDPGRMPLEGSDITATGLSVRALQRYAPGGLKDEVARRIGRARDWLLSTQPQGTEESRISCKASRGRTPIRVRLQNEWPRYRASKGLTVAGATPHARQRCLCDWTGNSRAESGWERSDHVYRLPKWHQVPAQEVRGWLLALSVARGGRSRTRERSSPRDQPIHLGCRNCMGDEPPPVSGGENGLAES